MWKTRLYVPDSDEEGESSISTQSLGEAPLQRTSSDDGFIDIDELDKSTEEPNLWSNKFVQQARNTELPTKPSYSHSSNTIDLLQGDLFSTDGSEDELALPAPKPIAETISSPYVPLDRLFTNASLPGLDRPDNLDNDARSAVLSAQELEEESRDFERPSGNEDLARNDTTPARTPSVPSSPLSSTRSSPSLILSQTRSSLTEITTKPVKITTNPQHADLETLIRDYDRTSRSRSFRARQPVQLHPYSIDESRYRLTFKRQGIKPVRWIETADTDKVYRRKESSPDVEYEEETEQIGASHEHTAQNNRSPELVLPSSPSNDNNSLPDFDRLLHANEPDVAHREVKRRKIRHNGYSLKRKRREENAATLRDQPAPINSPVLPEEPWHLDQFDIPPSPPSSLSQPRSSHAQVTTNGFRYPTGTVPAALPALAPQQSQLQTPDRTSEIMTPTARQPTGESNEGNYDSDRGPDISNAASNAEDETSSSDSESEAEMRRAKQRIKGVLPASWLRIDQKKQNAKPSVEKQKARLDAKSPMEPAQRGVARPVPTSRPTTSHSNKDNPFIIPDDGSSDIESPATRQRTPSRSRPSARCISPTTVTVDQFSLPLFGDDDESMEDNTFDRMMPPTGIKHRSHKKQKRHTRTRELGSTPLFKEPGPSRVRQTKISSHVTRKRFTKGPRMKSRAAQLSVADVMNAEESRSAPDFVRLAARSAIRRMDRGRQSPSRKILKLATREDTADVQETLTKWKRNEILRHSNSVSRLREVSRPRQPLVRISGNQRHSSLSQPKISWEERLIDVSRQKRDSCATIDAIVKQTKSRLGKDLAQADSTSDKAWKYQRIKGALTSNIVNIEPAVPALLEQAKPASRKPGPSKVAKCQTLPQNHSAADLKKHTILERYLESSPQLQNSFMGANESHETPVPSTRPKRKRTPRQLQITSSSLQQNVSVDEEFKLPEPIHDDPLLPDEGTALTDLTCYGKEYSTDFDIKALPPGTFFPVSSILGSGDFSQRVQRTSTRDMERPQDQIFVKFARGTHYWGAWTETVSSQISSTLEAVSQELKTDARQLADPPEIISVMAAFSKYLADTAFFLDRIDRASFVGKCHEILSDFICKMTTGIESRSAGCSLTAEVYQKLSWVTILSWQLQIIAQDEVVPPDKKANAEGLLDSTMRHTLKILFLDGISDFDKFIRAVQDYASTNALSHQCRAKVEAFVISLHLCKHSSRETLLWTTLNTTTTMSVPKSVRSVRLLEQKWFNIHVLLPFFDIDAEGKVVDDGLRHTTVMDNWSLVRMLLEPVLRAYETGSSNHALTFNDYLRVILGRCLHLIRNWEWSKCEAIIRRLYDFFTHNNLGDLRHEESRGSPRFLESLDDKPDLALRKEDRSFHIFLKILSCGLLGMRNTYSDKKIQGIAWRVTPNHSRSVPKDQDISHDDLGALRNHHSLLTVLYYASPQGRRPRLDTLRNLVCVEDSHREACQINMRAWSNLVNFQLSQNEPTSTLMDFVQWYDEFLEQTIKLHRTARTEVETHSAVVSTEEREAYVANNQRQIEAILIDALTSLKRAICMAQSPDARNVLLTSSLQRAFELFDPKQPRINGVILQALDIILSFTQLGTSPKADEDSQDYGEWFSFEGDAEINDAGRSSSSRLSPELYKALHNLLSNCFGAESIPTDIFLTKVIDTWVAVARTQVEASERSWSNYIDPYGQDSWAALRGTDQTLLYTPLFFARLIDISPETYEDHRTAIYHSWIASVVARESQLKFQNQLTSALLNRDPSEPLFENLPFVRSTNGKVEVSLADFSGRRLSLISCLLSNMRESLDFAEYNQLPDRRERRQEYTGLLRVLMRSMKETYEGLGSGPDIKGAYVQFVQQVVSFLQQYTADIHPVDRFFTDARTFPLPANDPTYVVGRLRSYGLKLRDAKAVKPLAIFVQNVIERAIVDNQEDYLAGQLQTAMSNTFEHGDASKYTLRYCVIQCIVPSYVKIALSNPIGWLLAMPLLRSLQGTLGSILLDLNCEDPSSLAAVTNTLATVLSSIQKSIALLVDHTGHLELAHMICTLTVYYALITAALRPLDYCIQLDSAARKLKPLVTYFRGFADFALGVMAGTYSASAPVGYDLPLVHANLLGGGIQGYVNGELNSTLQKNWHKDGGNYSFVRNGGRKKIDVDLLDLEDERARFRDQHGLFKAELERLPSFAEGRRRLIPMYLDDELWI
ncbi:MAG: hypothetical protein MMC23_005955 [Stictis urceolatum]|nr:hypothetical protein [Stictis urceolata]